MDFLNSYFVLSGLDQAGSFTGIASDWTMNRNGWQYAPGAFSVSLAAHKARGTTPAMLLFHDRSRPCGRWTSIEPKADALYVQGKVALGTKDGDEAYALLKAGALQALSTGCIHTKEAPAPGAGRSRGTIVSEADLFEISLLPVPGNANTKIVRVSDLAAPRDVEALFAGELILPAGLSNRKAKAAASAAWRAISATNEPEADPALSTILSTATAALARFKGKQA